MHVLYGQLDGYSPKTSNRWSLLTRSTKPYHILHEPSVTNLVIFFQHYLPSLTRWWSPKIPTILSPDQDLYTIRIISCFDWVQGRRVQPIDIRNLRAPKAGLSTSEPSQLLDLWLCTKDVLFPQLKTRSSMVHVAMVCILFSGRKPTRGWCWQSQKGITKRVT